MRIIILDKVPVFRRRASLDPEPDGRSRCLRYREGKIQGGLARTRRHAGVSSGLERLLCFILYIDQQMHNQ
jgi:hypothetical protein